jgi:hypothetical protein
MSSTPPPDFPILSCTTLSRRRRSRRHCANSPRSDRGRTRIDDGETIQSTSGVVSWGGIDAGDPLSRSPLHENVFHVVLNRLWPHMQRASLPDTSQVAGFDDLSRYHYLQPMTHSTHTRFTTPSKVSTVTSITRVSKGPKETLEDTSSGTVGGSGLLHPDTMMSVQKQASSSFEKQEYEVWMLPGLTWNQSWNPDWVGQGPSVWEKGEQVCVFAISNHTLTKHIARTCT